jgi:hypothetical protein
MKTIGFLWVAWEGPSAPGHDVLVVSRRSATSSWVLPVLTGFVPIHLPVASATLGHFPLTRLFWGYHPFCLSAAFRG